MNGPATLTRFRVRFLEQLLSEATAAYWDRRANDLERAAPRPGDHLGRATPEEVAARAAGLRDSADACRHHANLIRTDGLHGVGTLAWEALAEVAAQQWAEDPAQVDAYAVARIPDSRERSER